ncbi:hypothetical protein AAIR98_000782 [Elusimicrobium simillimum]|uniref:hypothetical protein n=1 Tax=Elusimicrobium simillimum TaxID=3143438 RepID=UPI003C7005E3
MDEEIGGMGIGATITHLWRIKKSNLWLGPSVTLSTIPKETLDFRAVDNTEIETSGYAFHFNLMANYYLTPNSKFQTYVSATAGYESLSVDIKKDNFNVAPGSSPIHTTSSESSSGFIGSLGLGVERKFGDTAIGLEARVHNASRGDALKDSNKTFYSALLKFSWKI